MHPQQIQTLHTDISTQASDRHTDVRVCPGDRQTPIPSPNLTSHTLSTEICEQTQLCHTDKPQTTDPAPYADTALFINRPQTGLPPNVIHAWALTGVLMEIGTHKCLPKNTRAYTDTQVHMYTHRCTHRHTHRHRCTHRHKCTHRHRCTRRQALKHRHTSPSTLAYGRLTRF